MHIEKNSAKTNGLLALSNTIIDLLVEIDEKTFQEFNLKKGEFHLVEETQAKEILQKLNQHHLAVEAVPGGSAANTSRGFVFLGGKSILYGKVGPDFHGELYTQEIQKLGILSRLKTHSSPTGTAFTFITPDAERTFSVHLGAALTLAKEDILEEDIQKSRILHLEGYQLEGPTQKTLLHALQLAKKHQTLISLDLADPGVIRRNKEFFKEIVQKYVDILFLNEKEAWEFTNLSPELAVQELAQDNKIALVKLGEKGSLLCQDGLLSFILPFPAQAVDTTGAGDLFAAGFLYGCCQGWALEKSARLGSLIASKIVEQKGVRVDKLNLEEIKRGI